jgi:pimeloyl-ACP methyl ester carboxylesterase
MTRKLIAALLAAGAMYPVADAHALNWTPCDDGLECATAHVPLDYDKPAGAKLELALIKLPAADPQHRIGTLFTNPGGPGNSGVAFVREEARDVYTDAVRARFDVVGFDPRGVGASTPVQCAGGGSPQPAFPVGVKQELAFAQAAADLGRRCQGELLNHLSTANVARDMDVLRAAVGDAKLTFAGHSYGSHLGATYASLFPNRVRAAVLDGVLDSNAWMNGAGPFSLRVGSQEASSRALRYFLDTCNAAGERCAFAGEDFDKLMARLRKAPIGGYTYADIVTIMRDVLAFTPGWASTAEALAAAAHGDELPPPPPVPQMEPAKLAIACGETDNPRLPLVWPLAARVADVFAPYFGSSWAYISQACATWPGHDEDRFVGPFRSSVPLLLVNSRFDAAASYEHAVRVASSLGRLLTIEGAGHTQATIDSPCADRAIERYLIAGSLPAVGAVCADAGDPFA